MLLKNDVPPVIEVLNEYGLETLLFFSVEKTEWICKIRASVKLLSDHARRTQYKLLLDEKQLKTASEKGLPLSNSSNLAISNSNNSNSSAVGSNYLVSPLHIPFLSDISPIRPHQFIYSELPAAGGYQIIYYFCFYFDYRNYFFITLISTINIIVIIIVTSMSIIVMEYIFITIIITTFK